jgi:hypothetical protein
MASQLTSPGVQATRYVTPLREGGSMPGLMEADDCGLHVVKFRGAGQGTLALAAEIIAAELAAPLGIRVPALKFIDIDAAIGTAEPDPEIQELLRASPGVNLGSDFLPGARTYSAADPWQPDSETAARIVWFDCFLNNVDRSARNPNLLIWHDELWAIDHGAALFRQHGGLDPTTASAPFPQIADHVLLDRSGSIVEVGERLATMVDEDAIADAVGTVPGDWFTEAPPARYTEWLTARLAHSPEFAKEAENAR